MIEKGHDVYATPDNKGVHEFLNKKGEDHLIIPIGMADLDEDNKEVHCNQIGNDRLSKAKRYTKKGEIERIYELTAYTHFAGDKAIPKSVDSDDDFMVRNYFITEKQEIHFNYVPINIEGESINELFLKRIAQTVQSFFVWHVKIGSGFV